MAVEKFSRENFGTFKIPNPPTALDGAFFAPDKPN